MIITPQVFVRFARARFYYLVRDFGFAMEERICDRGVQSGEVDFDSAKVAICPYWNQRDGLGLMITAKVDTFWIRPASSHRYQLEELLKLVAPDVLKQLPRYTWLGETEDEVEAWLGFCAGQLRAHAESLLRGDLGLCEDVLIMSYCNASKGLPMDEYFSVLRQECGTLPQPDRDRLEAAIAASSPRQVYFLLDEWVQQGRLRGQRICDTLNDFRFQYLH